MYHASKKQKPRDFNSGAVACQSRLNQQTVTFIFYGQPGAVTTATASSPSDHHHVLFTTQTGPTT